MKRFTLRAAALSLFLCASAGAAIAQPNSDPVFRGPKIHDGAWKTENAWSDAAQGDASKGSYAFHYQTWSRERAAKHEADGSLLDCADLSIALLCEYAAINKLPVSWRAYYPAERRFLTFTNTDKQFASPEDFRLWSQWFLGAMNLADNTDAISYDEWAGGDMVLMDWNQSDESPNFEGRTVWHTYLIGKPDEIVYYGNINDGKALPVTSVTGGSRMDMVRTHPDRHGLSPRRFRMFRNAVWGPTGETAKVIRVSNFLNLRADPSTGNTPVGRAKRGDSFQVIDRKGMWVRLIDSNGRAVWAHKLFLEISAPEASAINAGLANALPAD